MSSEHGETENGRANSVNDEEKEEEEDLPTGIQNEPNGDPDMDEDSATGSHQFSLDGLEKDQKGTVEPNGPGLLPVGLDRPSSADESLSIPDDTPSVQVRTSMKIVG